MRCAVISIGSRWAATLEAARARLPRPQPLWAFDPTSGAGAARYGGRFNPVGTPALYTSLRMETAWLEAPQGFAFKPQPLTICAYAVDYPPVLDLTDSALRRSLGVDSTELSCAWEDMHDRG